MFESLESTLENEVPGTVALIVAGGKGKRIGTPTNKQFLKIAGHPILCWTLWRFHQIKWINEIILVIPPNKKDYVQEEIIKKYKFELVSQLIPGGKERQESVYKGLQAINSNPEIVFIHDAVRPFVSPDSFERLYETVKNTGNAILGVPSRDTVKEIEESGIIKTRKRDKIWLVQTPQAFRYDIILDAHRQAALDGFEATDDSSLIERLKIPIHLVKGNTFNLKITTKNDLEISEHLVFYYFKYDTFFYIK
jgi:2-C-methyl-D-erythritol 4-phosphate cytidylyltransferase